MAILLNLVKCHIVLGAYIPETKLYSCILKYIEGLDSGQGLVWVDGLVGMVRIVIGRDSHFPEC